MGPWLSTLRVRTLPAAAAPVIVGAALAFRIEQAFLPAAIAALVGALLIQIGTNLANDHYDHKKGADTPDRAGPRRASASGDLDPVAVRNAAFLAFGLAALVGAYLVWLGGWPVVAIGVTAILSGVFYTAGSKALAYTGLADAFAFLFFGPVAVMGTVYVQVAGRVGGGPLDPGAALDVFAGPGVWMPAMFQGIAMGALVTAILVVNNLRDRPTDARVGKRTLAVRFGDRFAKAEYLALLGIAFLLALAAVSARGGHDPDWTQGLPLLALPFAIGPVRAVLRTGKPGHEDRARLNPVLGATARLLLVYALLQALGSVLGA